MFEGRRDIHEDQFGKMESGRKSRKLKLSARVGGLLYSIVMTVKSNDLVFVYLAPILCLINLAYIIVRPYKEGQNPRKIVNK